MRKLFLLVFLVATLIIPCSAEVVIYDNITTEQYKTLRVDDTTNFKYINEYPYVFYLNNSLYGNFQKEEDILYMDNTDVKILVPSPVKSDLVSSYDLGKSIWGIGLFIFLGFGIIAYAAVVIFRRAWKGK